MPWQKAANRVIRHLESLKGFDWFWHEVDPKTRREIRKDLAGIIEKTYIAEIKEAMREDARNNRKQAQTVIMHRTKTPKPKTSE